MNYKLSVTLCQYSIFELGDVIQKCNIKKGVIQMYKEVFAIRIKAIRNELGLTQNQVSKDTEIDQSRISKYETGELQPDLEKLGKLVEIVR